MDDRRHSPPERDAAEPAPPPAPGDSGTLEPPPPWTPPPLPEGMREVEVASARELVDAVAPNTRVVITVPEIDLTTLWTEQTGADYTAPHDQEEPPSGGEWVRFSNPFDGWELEIHDVTNLQIVGRGTALPRLVTRPRYVWVLQFVDSTGILVAHLSVGHSEEGYCLGGVLGFEGSADVAIEDTDLFGSGTYGIGLTRVSNVRVLRTTIRDCSYGILQLERTEDAEFRECVFRDNQEFDLIEIRSSRRIAFVDSLFRKNAAEGNALFLVLRSQVEVRGCTFRDNVVGQRVDGEGIEFKDCQFE